MFPVRTILHPTDFSPCSEYAFRLACSLARDYQARLIVFHVAEPPPFFTPGELQRVLQGPSGFRADLEERLRQFQVPGLDVSTEYRLEDGNAAVEIVSMAQKAPCDLIVMGTHGRTGLSRLLTGSVAEQVLRQAPCPVLTVKYPVPESARAGEAPCGTTATPG